MKKALLIFSFLFLIISIAFPQQDSYGWRVGIHGGLTNYYGDLSYTYWDPNSKTTDLFNNFDYFSYGLSIEKNFSPAWSLSIHGTKGQFIANDRTINRKGDLKLDNPNFDRALNAQTELYDASILLHYYFDNDKIFGKRAFIAPYLMVGGGYTNFEVFGDLFYDDGKRYHYWSDNTIRNVPEASGNEGKIIEQDGEFETNLTELQTENKDYETHALHLTAGIGLKFRLSGRLNLNVSTLVHFTNTDYLDDVSGTYPEGFDSPIQAYASNPGNQKEVQRGNPNGANDIFSFTSISLHYNFGRKKEAFKAPVIQTRSTSMVSQQTTSPSTTPEIDTGTEKPARKMEEKNAVYSKIEIIDKKIDSLLILSMEEKKAADSQPTELEKRIESLETLVTQLRQQQMELESSLRKELERIKRQDSIVVPSQTVEPPLHRLEDQTTTTDTAGQETKQTPAEQLEKDTVLIETTIEDTTSSKTDTIFVQSAPKEVVKIQKERTIYEEPNSTEDLQAIQQQLAKLETTLTERKAVNDNDTLAERQLRELEKLNQQLIQQEALLQEGSVDESTISAMRQSLAGIQLEVTGQLPPPQTTLRTDTVILKQNDSLQQEVNKLNQELLTLGSKVERLELGLQRDTVSKLLPNWEVLNLAQQLKELEKRMAETEQEKDQKIVLQNQQIEQLEDRLAGMKLQIDFLNKQQSKPKEKVIPEDPGSLLAEKIKDKDQQVVFFAISSTKISSKAAQTIRKMSDLMKEHDRLIIVLEGYTDTSGNPDFNRKLALKRAQAVADFIQAQGISSERITIRGVGEDPNAEAEYGRRVELELIIF